MLSLEDARLLLESEVLEPLSVSDKNECGGLVERGQSERTIIADSELGSGLEWCIGYCFQSWNTGTGA